MKLFNSIQIVALLMASPILLSLCKAATFTGAVPLYYIGILGVIALFCTVVGMVYSSISNN